MGGGVHFSHVVGWQLQMQIQRCISPPSVKVLQRAGVKNRRTRTCTRMHTKALPAHLRTHLRTQHPPMHPPTSLTPTCAPDTHLRTQHPPTHPIPTCATTYAPTPTNAPTYAAQKASQIYIQSPPPHPCIHTYMDGTVCT